MLIFSDFKKDIKASKISILRNSKFSKEYTEPFVYEIASSLTFIKSGFLNLKGYWIEPSGSLK